MFGEGLRWIFKKEREAFEKSNNVHPDWSFKFDRELEQYVALDHEMQLQVDEFNEHWDTFRAGWLAAKQQAVPDGFVLVPTEPTQKMLDATINLPIPAVYVDSISGQHKLKVVAYYKAMIQESQK